MAQPISINGTRLDEVRMPMVPYNNRTEASLSYPAGQFHISRGEHTLCLIVPVNLGLELYRIGILPQDAKTPIEIAISGRSVGRYVVSDVRYPNTVLGPFEKVTFTFTSVSQGSVRTMAGATPRSRSDNEVQGMFVADITHYLSETGEVAEMPGPARRLASFLTLLIDAATGAFPAPNHDSGIRCRKKGCKGTIRTLLPTSHDKISWVCPRCGHQGTISNWQQTKWNRLTYGARPE